MPVTTTESCHRCHAEIVPTNDTAGCGMDDEGNRYCYACCAERDKESMRSGQRISLYLTKKDGEWQISNWPGSLVIKPTAVRSSKVWTFGRRVTRSYAWFVFEGQQWFGRQQGEGNDIIHCKQLLPPRCPGRIALLNNTQYTSHGKFVILKELKAVTPGNPPFLPKGCEFTGSTCLEHSEEISTRIPRPFELVVEFAYTLNGEAGFVVAMLTHKAYTAIIGEPHPDFVEEVS